MRGGRALRLLSSTRQTGSLCPACPLGHQAVLCCFPQSLLPLGPGSWLPRRGHRGPGGQRTVGQDWGGQSMWCLPGPHAVSLSWGPLPAP